jgi:hypothetical protein
MKISSYDFKQAVGYFFSLAGWAFGITLILGLAAGFLGEGFKQVMLSAIAGQIAVTLLKICFYVGLFFLSLSFIFRKWPKAYDPLHKIGDVVGGIGFSCSAVAAGLSAGLVGGLVFEIGLIRAFLVSLQPTVFFISICSVLWVAANAKKQAAPVQGVREGVALSVVAFFIGAMTTASLYCETWSEVEGLKISRDENVCKVFKLVHAEK